MHEFVRAGAPEEIMYVNKPHIGTFRLTGVVAAMRAELTALGGEVRFESKVTDLLLENGGIEGVVLADGTTVRSRHVVVALGHSSRDTFRMLHRRGVFIEPKPFAVGFRIEHPQSPDRPGPDSENTRVTPSWAPRTTSWFITRRTAVRSIASACVPAELSSRPPPSRSAW